MINMNVYEKHYAIIVEQNFFLEYKHLNSKSLLEISLLLIETKVGKNASIFTKKFNSSFSILMIYVIF